MSDPSTVATTATTPSTTDQADAAAPGSIAVSKPVRSRPRWLRTLLSRDAIVYYALIAVIVYAYTQVPYFASTQTVGFLLLDVIPILAIAMPMALVIITGEIDLSVASTVGLTSAVMGVLFEAGMPIGAVMLVCLLIGLACGAVNGLLITALGLPSLAVTIGTLALYRGFALVVIGDNAVANFPIELTSFATSKLGATGIPTVMVFVAIIAAFFGVLLHFTPFGRSLFALGYSKDAATFVGIKVARAKFWLFVATGLVSSMIGIFWTLRYSSARSDNATGIELAVIAAVLLGGVSIFGGKGSIPGVIGGVLLIGTINYTLRLARVSDVVLSIVTGALLVASVVAPSIIDWAKGAVVRSPVQTRRSSGSGPVNPAPPNPALPNPALPNPASPNPAAPARHLAPGAPHHERDER